MQTAGIDRQDPARGAGGGQAFGYRDHWYQGCSRFDGTCYQAANWQCLGMTSGPGPRYGEMFQH